MRCPPLALFASLALVACSEPAPSAAPPEERAATPGQDEAPDRAAGEAPDAGAAPTDVSPIRLGRPVLLDFSRDHCLPCELMRPWLDELRRRHARAVEVIEVNIDRPENKALAVFFKARSVPMQVYVDADGREVSRSTGIATLAQMQNQIERLGFSKE